MPADARVALGLELPPEMYFDCVSSVIVVNRHRRRHLRLPNGEIY